MNIVRYVGYALLCGALLLLGYELFRYLDTKLFNLVTVEQMWRDRSATGLDHLNKTVREGYFAGFFGEILAFIVSLPLLFVMLLLGAYLMFLSRHSEAAR